MKVRLSKVLSFLEMAVEGDQSDHTDQIYYL